MKLTLGDFDFYLYYLDSLKSDWQNFYYDACGVCKYYNLLEDERNEIKSKTINTIIKHLNKQEFKRFMIIHNKLDIGWYSVLHKLSNKERKLSNIFYQIFKTNLKEKVEESLFYFKHFKNYQIKTI